MKTINQILMNNSSFFAPIGRFLIALMFVMSGLNKIYNYSNTPGWMDYVGVPSGLLPLVILLEIFVGIAIIAGWQTRVTAFLFAGFSTLSAVIFHADFADQNEMIHFIKNTAITGGFLFLIVYGAESYSLDNYKQN